MERPDRKPSLTKWVLENHRLNDAPYQYSVSFANMSVDRIFILPAAPYPATRLESPP